MYDSIIILGATATGKTKISIELAKKLNTEIINADSMYIYKELSIGTAKPSHEEMDGVVHHLIDIAEPHENFNVVDYRCRAKNVIQDFKNRNILPIIVGGTGFYIDSLTKNYTYGNTSCSQEIRNQLTEDLKNFGKEFIYNKLVNLSPSSAEKLHQNDTVRVIRALEICMASGNNELINENNEEIICKKPLYIGLMLDREDLYSKINRRVDIMVNSGLIDEVQELWDKGYRPDTHQSMKGIGYKEICEYFAGNCSLNDAVEKIKQHTRNYAKRQITYFKRNSEIIWFNTSKDTDIVDKIITLYQQT